ncbi:MAG TPA: family 16 glycosylhydrolase [Bacteroidia bacterium]|nr:family 16 glycosylhydrolase [Bacteroidia bacterium]
MLGTKKIQAQIPINDSAWVLQTAHSDEFNNSYLDTTIWTHANYWPPYTDTPWLGDGASVNYRHNISFVYNPGLASGVLKMKVDSLIQSKWIKIKPSSRGLIPDSGITVVYEGERIWTNYQYKYGYLEAHARYPKNHLYPWAALWLFNNFDSTDITSSWYNEIDICENADISSDSGYTSTNIHVNKNIINYGTDTAYWVNTDSVVTYKQPGIADTNFHTYSVQWDPGQVIYYLDGTPIRRETKNLPTHGMGLNIEAKVFPWDVLLPADWDRNTTNPGDVTHQYYLWNLGPTGFPSPSYFEVDYVRYYQLNTACSTAKTICNPIADYDTGSNKRAVYQSITTGGISCNPTFNTSNGFTLRATDYVEMGAGTTINPNGSGQFSVIIQSCPQ